MSKVEHDTRGGEGWGRRGREAPVWPGRARVQAPEAAGSEAVRWEKALGVPRHKDFVDEELPRPTSTRKPGHHPTIPCYL